LDDSGRRQLLGKFSSVLRRLPGSVDLRSPAHTLVYYEDWHDYQLLHNRAQEQLDYSSLSDEKPRRLLLGRVLVQGENFAVKYDLRHRPFLGTTSMKAICAHVSAMAVGAGPDRTLLDPFCGSASLLVSAAMLGADVWGSDLDALSVLGENDNATTDGIDESKLRKNGKFRRRDGQTQAGRSARDNFHFYNLQSRLLALQHRDALDWLVERPEDPNKVRLKIKE
jgi:hypothetical protein